MTCRDRLPNRRRCESFEFAHAGMQFTATMGFYPNGEVAEIFLSSNKPGTAVEAVARDAAIVTSIALQHGASIQTILGALTRDHDGGPATILGAALDCLGVPR